MPSRLSGRPVAGSQSRIASSLWPPEASDRPSGANAMLIAGTGAPAVGPAPAPRRGPRGRSHDRGSSSPPGGGHRARTPGQEQNQRAESARHLTRGIYEFWRESESAGTAHPTQSMCLALAARPWRLLRAETVCSLEVEGSLLPGHRQLPLALVYHDGIRVRYSSQAASSDAAPVVSMFPADT